MLVGARRTALAPPQYANMLPWVTNTLLIFQMMFLAQSNNEDKDKIEILSMIG